MITTIVPEADCAAELNGFSSAEGLDGFSGFVSWHDLTGRLVWVAEYENGVRTRSAEPAGDDEKDIIDIVDDAVLYPVETDNMSPIHTKAFPEFCFYCKKKIVRLKIYEQNIVRSVINMKEKPSHLLLIVGVDAVIAAANVYRLGKKNVPNAGKK